MITVIEHSSVITHAVESSHSSNCMILALDSCLTHSFTRIALAKEESHESDHIAAS
jgi:hypothetical protein